MYSETYWREITDRAPDFRSSLEREAAKSRLTLAFVNAPQGTNYFEDLRQSVQKHPSDLVITGPLLSNEAVRIAPLFPAKKFAVLDMPRIDAAAPPNVVPVRSQRAAAFYEAGKLTGAVLSSGILPAAGKKVGVILSGLTGVEKEMLSEFERGFSVKNDTGQISVVELGTVTDRVKASRAVEDLLNQDVRLFFVKAYGLNGACLERIVNGGGYFIVEDASTFFLAKDKLFLSIEDDYPPAFAELLRQATFTYPVLPVLPAKVVRGDAIGDFKEN